MNPAVEQVNVTTDPFFNDCLDELRIFIGEQIAHLTKIPEEVPDPSPRWSPKNNSAAASGVVSPTYKASFLGHITEVKAKRDLYPRRLRILNGNGQKLLINELYKLSKIYEQTYKVRTDRSKPMKKQTAHFRNVQTQISTQQQQIMKDFLSIKTFTGSSSQEHQSVTVREQATSTSPAPLLSPPP